VPESFVAPPLRFINHDAHPSDHLDSIRDEVEFRKALTQRKVFI
jgi:hypothetical protein